MKTHVLLFLTVVLIMTIHVLHAQIPDPNIKNYYEVKESQIFRIDFGQLCTGCTMTAPKHPDGATTTNIDFIWSTPVASPDPYEVHFVEKDPNDNIIFEKNVLIMVRGVVYDPVLKFSDPKVDDPGPIPATEAVPFEFTVTAESKNARNPEDIKLFFVINKDPNIRSLDGATIIINNDLLSFKWEPTNEQAKKQFINLRIIAIDNLGRVASKDIVFRIEDKNQMPRLMSYVQDEYTINPKKALEIDFTVVDPDNDPLVSLTDLATSDGDLSFINGKFKWDLKRITPVDTTFPVTVKLTTKETSDGSHFVTKSITIRLEVDNVPPEIEKIGDLTFREGSLIKIPFVIKDEDPATVSVALEDFDSKIQSNLIKELKLNDAGLNRFILETELPLSYASVSDDSVFLLVIKVTDANGLKNSSTIKLTITDERDPREVEVAYQEMKRRASVILADDQNFTDFLNGYLHKRRRNATVVSWIGILFGTAGLVSEGIDATKPKKEDDAPKAFPIVGVAVAIAALFKDGWPGSGDDQLKLASDLLGRTEAREELQSTVAVMDNELKQPDYNAETFSGEFHDFETLIGKSKVNQENDLKKLKTEKRLLKAYNKYVSRQKEGDTRRNSSKKAKKRVSPYV